MAKRLLVVIILFSVLCIGYCNQSEGSQDTKSEEQKPDQQQDQHQKTEEKTEEKQLSEDQKKLYDEHVDKAALAFTNHLQLLNKCWQFEMGRCLPNCNYTFTVLQDVCGSYCQADTAWKCTARHSDHPSAKIYKFGGRWPFRKIFFFCEGASTIFCFINTFVGLYLFTKYRSETKINKFVNNDNANSSSNSNSNNSNNNNNNSFNFQVYESSPTLQLDDNNIDDSNYNNNYPWVVLWQISVLIWLLQSGSAIFFHIVDIPLTERADYFSVVIAGYFALYVSIIRVFEIKKLTTMLLVLTPIVGWVLFHIKYMLERFRYSFHNKSIGVGIGTMACVWCLWAIYNFRKYPPARYHLIIWPILALFSVLEIGTDFPPIYGYFDAHSLWHLSQIPCSILLHKFGLADFRHWNKTRNETPNSVDKKNV